MPVWHEKVQNSEQLCALCRENDRKLSHLAMQPVLIKTVCSSARGFDQTICKTPLTIACNFGTSSNARCTMPSPAPSKKKKEKRRKVLSCQRSALLPFDTSDNAQESFCLKLPAAANRVQSVAMKLTLRKHSNRHFNFF